MMIEAEESNRSRRTSIMSESEDIRGDAIDGAFKRAMKGIAPMGDFNEADEEQSEASVNSSHKSAQSAASSAASSMQSHGSSHISIGSKASGISEVASHVSGKILKNKFGRADNTKPMCIIRVRTGSVADQTLT
jgi:hypothetical protein